MSAQIIEYKNREPKNPTLDDEMKDIMRGLGDGAMDLEIMFIYRPELAAKYARQLNRMLGNLCLTMAKIDEHNGN